MSSAAIVTALLVGNLAPNAVPVKELAPAIVRAAARHSVDAELLARIIVVESRGVASAVNLDSDDHGLVQINAKTAARYKLTSSCLKNWKCNLDAAAMILSDLLKIRGTTPCAYNLGPKGRFDKFKEACNRYETKLASL